MNATPEIDSIRLLDAKAAAEALRISPRSLWSLTHSGCIGHVRIGRRILYKPADIAAFIESATVHRSRNGND